MLRDSMHSASDAPLEERNRPAKPQQAAPNVAKVNRAPAPNPKFISPPPPEPHLARAYAMVKAGIEADRQQQLANKSGWMNNCGWGNGEPSPCSGPLQSPSASVSVFLQIGTDNFWYIHVEINEPDCSILNCNTVELVFYQDYLYHGISEQYERQYKLTLDCNTLPYVNKFKVEPVIYSVPPEYQATNPPSEWIFSLKYYFVSCCGYQTSIGTLYSN